MWFTAFWCVVVLTTLSTNTNSLIPLRPRATNGTATENVTATPDLALRHNDATEKEKIVYYKDKGGQLFKRKEGKIVNTGGIEKQIIVNIENQLRPVLNILLENGMLNNLICGNLNTNCEPEYTTPLSERISNNQSTTPNSELTVSLSLDADENVRKSEESEENEHYKTSEKPKRPKSTRHFPEEIITEAYSQTTAYDSDKITKPYSKKIPGRASSLGSQTKKYRKSITIKPIFKTIGTTRRPTRISAKRSTKQPKPNKTTASEIITIGRKTTKSRWPKRTTRGTTELTIEISELISFGDKTEQNTKGMNPTTRKQTTKLPDYVTDGISVTYPVSDESTIEMSESTDSN